MYEWTGADVPDAAAPNVEVYQGFTERSNVNPQQAMVDLMQVQRLYEANQRTIQAYDRSLEKAVNEIGRLG
nr:flagellar basal body rod C-terminal domain-containing protein [Novibacillus thermophilus]